MTECTRKDGKATFTIQIQFQQHATWQGTIAWAEGGKIQKFRSELEMIKLMMEAIPRDDEDKEPGMSSSWG
ncbi:hypothetical protein [Sinanaerobacter chloroacetimidivorans]|jgi:hypothetical protein|uniref:Uncharacterized protein n=1 Tax=Sinanaerobacter chloroacetimidivorans TaxID=2818044 RepID=A0A8J7W4A3_9FIRM|nr:hypothetical protein [Sinanaerobacter chloroacetimidivorans]MBR0598863.1 hypothetical protein [Sinanaerobacter chloroacetimidivorans]